MRCLAYKENKKKNYRQSTNKPYSWKQQSTQVSQSSMSEEQLINDAMKKLRIVMSSAQPRHVEKFSTFDNKTNAVISQNHAIKFVVYYIVSKS